MINHDTSKIEFTALDLNRDLYSQLARIRYSCSAEGIYFTVALINPTQLIFLSNFVLFFFVHVCFM